MIFPMISKRSFSDREVWRDRGRIEFLFKKNKVTILSEGMVRSAGEIEIGDGKDAGKVISGSKIMIATGCKPRTLDKVAVDGSNDIKEARWKNNLNPLLWAGAGAEFAIFSMHLEQK